MFGSKLESIINKIDNTHRIGVARREQLIEEQARLDEQIANLNIEVFEQVNVFLQKLSEERREAACRMFTDLGTQALQYSLGPDYEMVIEIKEIRKKPNAVIWIRNTETDILTDPMCENGGGVVDIISIALRWVMLTNLDETNDGPIIMDEPFKMVSKEFVPLVTTFIKRLSEQFNRQVIMVTHNNHLAESCDAIIEVQKVDGISRATRTK